MESQNGYANAEQNGRTQDGKATNRKVHLRKESHRPSLQMQRVLGKNRKSQTSQEEEKTNGTSKEKIEWKIKNDK